MADLGGTVMMPLLDARTLRVAATVLAVGGALAPVYLLRTVIFCACGSSGGGVGLGA